MGWMGAFFNYDAQAEIHVYRPVPLQKYERCTAAGAPHPNKVKDTRENP
jgi:hypothetical protein